MATSMFCVFTLLVLPCMAIRDSSAGLDDSEDGQFLIDVQENHMARLKEIQASFGMIDTSQTLGIKDRKSSNESMGYMDEHDAESKKTHVHRFRSEKNGNESNFSSKDGMIAMEAVEFTTLPPAMPSSFNESQAMEDKTARAPSASFTTMAPPAVAPAPMPQMTPKAVLLEGSIDMKPTQDSVGAHNGDVGPLNKSRGNQSSFAMQQAEMEMLSRAEADNTMVLFMLGDPVGDTDGIHHVHGIHQVHPAPQYETVTRTAKVPQGLLYMKIVLGVFLTCLFMGCLVQCCASRDVPDHEEALEATESMKNTPRSHKSSPRSDEPPVVYQRAPSTTVDDAFSFVWTPIDEQIFKQALPAIASNMSTPLIGIVDTVVSGHLGTHELTAVAVGVSSFTVMYNIFIFLRKGTTGIAGQANGSKDYAEVRATALRSIGIGFLSGLVLFCCREHVMWLIFEYIKPPSEGLDQCRAYFMARILSAPVALANFAIQGFLCGMLKGKQVLCQQVVLNLTNAICCVVLATKWGYGMGVAGIGYAASIANAVAFVNGMYQVNAAINGGFGQQPLPGQFELSRVWNMDGITEMFKVSTTIILRSFCLTLTQSGFTAVGSRLTTKEVPILQANLVCLQLHLLMTMGTDGFSNAAEALVAQAIGQKNPVRLHNVLMRSCIWGFSIGTMFSCIWAFFGPSIFEGLTTDIFIQETALAYLPWLVIGSFLSVWAFLFDGFFVGATLVVQMLRSMFFSTAGFSLVVFICVGGNLGLHGPWGMPLLSLGNHGLWLAFYAFLVFRALGLGAQFNSLMEKGSQQKGDQIDKGTPKKADSIDKGTPKSEDAVRAD